MAWNASSHSYSPDEDASADAQNHRSVPLDQHGERQLGGLAAVGGEALKELAVGQVADDSDVEERFELVNQGRALVAFHWWRFSAGRMVRNCGPYGGGSRRASRSALIQVMYRGALEVPRFWRIRAGRRRAKAFDHARESVVRTGNPQPRT